MKKHSDFFLKVDNYFENLQLKLQEKILSIEKNFTKLSKKTAPDETNSLRLAHPILDKHGKHQQFCVDEWQKPKNEKTYGKGKTTILEQGIVFEKAGIGFSNVFGHSLPKTATERDKDLTKCHFQAHGVSLIFHPVNPYCPTVHFNLRHFEVIKDDILQTYWFGGGMDLTPCYGFTEDAIHFHRCCSDALKPESNGLYKKFKYNCDKYFYLPHRNETRGIGGIFFDDFCTGNPNEDFSLIKSIGESFIPAYFPIIENRHSMAYGIKERSFQAYRRGRYVEFNLLYDRGTHFGLQTGWRTESILLSMPPIAAWQYDWKPESGSPEENLYLNFLRPVDWLNFEKKD